MKDIVSGPTVIKDSGNRQQFETGARRDIQQGKGRYDLLPMHAIERVAKIYEGGAVKYGEDNWRKGIPLRRYCDSALRHLCKAIQGQTDEDHFAMAAWNLMSLMDTQFMIKQGILPEKLNDLPNWHERKPEPQEGPHPMLCVHHGGSRACEEMNASNGFDCPKCIQERVIDKTVEVITEKQI